MMQEIEHVLTIKVIATIFLSFVPVKTLLRLRCVCKKWYDIVHNSKFISMHNFAHKNRNLIMIHRHTSVRSSGLIHEFFRWDKSTGNKPFNELPLDYSPTPLTSYHKFYFHGSCNGLVCCSTTMDYKGRALYIWNPSLKKFKVIKSDSYHTRPLVCGIGQKANVAGDDGGGGGDDDYKVVSFSYTKNYFLAGVDVYTLSTNSWKSTNVKLHTYIDRTHSASVLVKGVLHWLGSKSRKDNDVLVTFDLQNEALGEIMLPRGGEESDKKQRFMYLGKLKESLALTSTSVGSLSIWVMKRYDVVESWSKLFTIGFPDCVPIYFGCSGLLVNTRHGKLLLLDLEVRKWVDLYEVYTCFSGSCRAIDYHESLALINEK